MSTLTSSPSPAASPGSSFHIQRTSYSSYPFTSSSSPKPRSFNASPVLSSQGSSTGPRQPRAHHVGSPATEKAPRYVQEGTQYSPDGYPPTTTYIPPGKGKEREVLAKKRKERTHEARLLSAAVLNCGSTDCPFDTSCSPSSSSDHRPQSRIIPSTSRSSSSHPPVASRPSCAARAPRTASSALMSPSRAPTPTAPTSLPTPPSRPSVAKFL